MTSCTRFCSSMLPVVPPIEASPSILVYSQLASTWKRAGEAGRLVEHVDLPSLRRTFAANAITAPKRQAPAELNYSGGVSWPGHLVQFWAAIGG
jgi:hypothetical protein